MEWTSFHVQICGMYNRPVTITLASCFPPPRMKSYAWALRRLPPSAQRIATALHTIVTSLLLFRHKRIVLCSQSSLNRASCMAILQPNSNNTAPGAAITGASRVTTRQPCLLLKKATGQRVMQCNMRSGFLKLKIIITAHSRRD
jgi:hypothetical protein